MELYNELAEKYVLASILTQVDNGRKVFEKIKDYLKPEDFYFLKHRLIFHVILELYEQNEKIDVVTVYKKLEEKNETEKCGGASYLTELAELLPTSGLITSYAKIVKELSIFREINNFLNDLNLKLQISTSAEEVKVHLKEAIEKLQKFVKILEGDGKIEKTKFEEMLDRANLFFQKACNNPSTLLEEFVFYLFEELKERHQRRKRRFEKSK